MSQCILTGVIQIARSEIGYLEKKSNSQLDSKTANAGRNNYTKYNRDYMAWTSGGSINMQWCAAFVSWCFVKAYGLEAAKTLLCGGLHCYTPTGAGRFKKKGQYVKRGEGKPQAGDIIYFYSASKGRIGHVGIVEKVSSTKVYTIEGNTSGANTLITNGGGVRRKSYSLSSTYIDGYGRPDYAAVESGADGADAPELGDRLLVNGCEGDDVKALQEALLNLGYDLGRYGADGEFGDCTELAVIAFQKDHGLEADGEYGEKTHAALQTALERAKGSEDGKTVQIVGGQCWVRAEPGTAGKKLGIAKEGTTWAYRGMAGEDGWLGIAYEGQDAWVSGKYGRLMTMEEAGDNAGMGDAILV